MEKKLTKKDFYNAIKEVMATGECAIDPNEVIAFCDNEIEMLDKKAAKAKERQAAKKAEGDELTEIVREALTEDFQIATDIAASLIGKVDESVTIHKIQYRLGALVKAGVAESTDVKIPGSEGVKATTRKGYRIAVEG